MKLLLVMLFTTWLPSGNIYAGTLNYDSFHSTHLGISWYKKQTLHKPDNMRLLLTLLLHCVLPVWCSLREVNKCSNICNKQTPFLWLRYCPGSSPLSLVALCAVYPVSTLLWDPSLESDPWNVGSLVLSVLLLH